MGIPFFGDNGPLGAFSDSLKAVQKLIATVRKDLQGLAKDAEKVKIDAPNEKGKGVDNFSEQLSGKPEIKYGGIPGLPGFGGLGNILLGAGGIAALMAGGSALKAVGGIAIGGLPSTNEAVQQRKMSQFVASYSGLSNPQSITRRANAAGEGGITSNMSMTAASQQFMMGGYAFNSRTVQSNLGQIGGMSVITGMGNEQVAAGIAGINAMNFYRVGIQARRPDGSLRPIGQIGEDLFKRMYGGRDITPEQAAHVMRPTSAAYKTIQAVSGGDPSLMAQLQAYIMMRAKSGKKVNLKNTEKMKDLMGFAHNSPERTEFRYQGSEARKLEVSEQGMVEGYSDALNMTSQFNDMLSSSVEALGGFAQALLRAKGALETLPGAGNMGPQVFGLLKGAAEGFGKIPFIGPMLEGLFNALGGGPPVGGPAGPITGSGAMTALNTGGMGGPPSNRVEHAMSQMYVSPVPKGSPVSSNFGWRMLRGKKDHHGGIDYGVKIGTPVFAVKDGVAKKTGHGTGYGKYVQINHGDGYSSYYAHLSQELVKDGQKVKAGQLIGKSGNTDDTGRSTGPHLHFEIKKNGSSINPRIWLGGAKKQGKNDGLFGGIKDFFEDVGENIISGAGKFFEGIFGNWGKPNLIIGGDEPFDLMGTVSGVLGNNIVSNFWDSWTGSPKNDEYAANHGKSTDDNTIGSSKDMFNTGSTKGITYSGGKYNIGKVRSGKGLTNLQLVALLLNSGFSNTKRAYKNDRSRLAVAFGVARAESGGNPGAVGDTTIQGMDKDGNDWGPSYGIFQIRSLKNWRARGAPTRDGSRLPDPQYNVDSAYKISQQGLYWKRGWTEYRNGDYKAEMKSDAEMKAMISQLKEVSNVSGMSTGGVGGPIDDSRSYTINMNVHIERASEKEAVMLAERVKRILENDSRYRNIGAN